MGFKNNLENKYPFQVNNNSNVGNHFLKEYLEIRYSARLNNTKLLLLNHFHLINLQFHLAQTK